MILASRTGVLRAVLLFAWLGPLAAQKPSNQARNEDVSDKTATRISLGSTSGTADSSVVVPIYLSPEQGDIGKLELQISYVSTNMKFAKLSPAMSVEQGNIHLHSEVEHGKNERGVETETLKIVASVEEFAKIGIPPGLLGYLTLRISQNGLPGSIPLLTNATATQLGTNQPFSNVKTVDAQVEVLAPGSQPLVTCFFFTH